MKRKKVAALLLTMSLATAGAATAISGCGAFAGTDENQDTSADDTGDEKTIDLGDINFDEGKNTPVDRAKEEKNENPIAKVKEDAEEKGNNADGTENETSDKGSVTQEKTVTASWSGNNTINQKRPAVSDSSSKLSVTVKPSVPVKDDKTDAEETEPSKEESSKPVTPSKPSEKPEAPADPVKDDTSGNPMTGDGETATEPEVPVQPPKDEDTAEDTDEGVEPENPGDGAPDTDDGNGDSGQDFDTDGDTGDIEDPDEDGNPSTPEAPDEGEDASDEDMADPGAGDVDDDESTTNPDDGTADTDGENDEDEGNGGQTAGSDDDIDEPVTEAPEHTHDWVDHYITVEVEEKGHYENVLKSEAWTETINHPEESHIEYVHHPEESHYEQKWIYQCHGCKKKFNTDAEIGAHMKEQLLAGNLACGGYSSFMDKVKVIDKEAWTEEVKVVDKEAWTEYIEHDAVYEQVWVVDEEAHTETVVDGQVCADCGEWKE